MIHLVSATDLSREQIDHIFDRARHHRRYRDQPINQPLTGKIIASLFYEPSTRTRMSFESATLRLGGRIISTENAKEFSSAAKGETIEDTVRVISQYVHLIVLRHDKAGSATKAAAVSSVPIINGGDGVREHPSQALLDLFTIKDKLGRLEDLHIGLAGDLLNGRTIHSLVKLLNAYGKNIKLSLIAPAQLDLPLELSQNLNLGIKDPVLHYTSFAGAPLDELDCLYMTRVQKERFGDARDYEAVKDCCVLYSALVERMKPEAIVMHPLPRVDELKQSVDTDPRAIYFEQAENGLYIRMALLETIITEVW